MPTEEEYRKMINESIGRAVLEGSRSQFEENTGVGGARGDEEFSFWLKKAKRNQMKRWWRCMASVAAVFLCLFLGIGLLCHLPADDQAFARHGQVDQVEEQGGSIVIGGDGNGNVGTWTATFTSYEDIPEQYKEEIVWFEELPEGYELKEIRIQRDLNTLTARFDYYNGDTLIQIREVRSNRKEYTNNVIQLNGWDYYTTYGNVDIYQRITKKTRMYSFFKKEIFTMLILDGQNEKKGDKICLQSMINTIT